MRLTMKLLKRKEVIRKFHKGSSNYRSSRIVKVTEEEKFKEEMKEMIDGVLRVISNR
jgi:hypothetical protein